MCRRLLIKSCTIFWITCFHSQVRCCHFTVGTKLSSSGRILCHILGTGLDWKPCPRGSYSNSTGLSKESQCLSCDSGYYCDMPGSTKPRALCHGGYYCESGVDRPNPIHAENVSSSLTSNCSVLGYHTGRYFSI